MKRITLALLAAAVMFGAAANDSKSTFTSKLNTLGIIVRALNDAYVDTLPAEEVMNNAIEYMLYQVDPYTEYIPRTDTDEVLQLSTGSYAGIGAAIMKRPGGGIVISNPYHHAPAYKAGVRAGDRILMVDSHEIGTDADVSLTSARLRGQAGTTVHVRLERPYATDSIIDIDIVRDDIRLHPVPWYGTIAPGIGYIPFNTFSESGASEVRAALADMLAAGTLEGLILDLRNNGGGLIEEAVQIVSLFVPRATEVVSLRGRNPEANRVYKTPTQPLAPDIPLVILVNENTASASEIVAGTLQDLDRAVVMGRRTYGKGLVQNTFPLPGDEILKITTARYYIPSGRLIQARDYRHPNEDGSPYRMPDSLTMEFTTRGGRIVRDGGGIAPDTVLPQIKYTHLDQALARNNWAFDFATRYVARNPEAPAEGSTVDSTVFNQFHDYLLEKGFTYQRPTAASLDYLRDAAKAEGLDSPELEAQIQALAAAMTQDLQSELNFNREYVISLLEQELGVRYFNDSEMTRRSIPGDSEIQAAAGLLQNRDEYRRLLRP